MEELETLTFGELWSGDKFIDLSRSPGEVHHQLPTYKIWMKIGPRTARATSDGLLWGERGEDPSDKPVIKVAV